MQQQYFDRLVELKLPEEWAHLIAMRARCLPNPYVEQSASAILYDAFSWRHSPEGFDFWEGVKDAIVAEEQWTAENGDLTVEQVEWIDKMLSVGMPQEWAILIAQRMAVDKSPYAHSSSRGYFMRQKSAAGCLIESFSWNKFPEGFDFWDSVHKALCRSQWDGEHNA
jgi:hypothetical protein